MTKFAVSGELDGQAVKATWKDGTLTGDEPYVRTCQLAARVGLPVYIGGVVDQHAELTTHTGALATMLTVLDERKGAWVTGDELPVEPANEGDVN